MRGLLHTPFTHSFAQAGAYPPFPVFRFSQRIGNTSSRPAKRRRNSATFADDDEAMVTGGVADVFNAELGASKTARWRSNSSSLSLSASCSVSRARNRARTCLISFSALKFAPVAMGHFNLTTGESNSV
jgi:hypothetical protein